MLCICMVLGSEVERIWATPLCARLFGLSWRIPGQYFKLGGPDSSVGMATGYDWTVRGSNPGEGEIFRTCPDRPWGPPSLMYNGHRVFPGGKGATGA